MRFQRFVKLSLQYKIGVFFTCHVRLWQIKIWRAPWDKRNYDRVNSSKHLHFLPSPPIIFQICSETHEILKIEYIPLQSSAWTLLLNWFTSAVLILWITPPPMPNRFHIGIFRPPSAIFSTVVFKKGKWLHIDLVR